MALRRTLLLVSACWLAAGCLPRGPAPAGRRLLADGTVYGVQFVPGPPGSPGSLIITRLMPDPAGPFAVYALHEPDGDGLGSELLLSDHATGTTSDPYCPYPCFPFSDSLGRLFIERDELAATSAQGFESFVNSFVRADPGTGAVLDLGPDSAFIGTFSQGNAFAYTVSGALHVRDLEDREAEVAHVVGTPAVANDALYFVTVPGPVNVTQAQPEPGSPDMTTLRRLAGPPFDSPQTVASGVSSFTTYRGGPPLLVLCRTMTGDLRCAPSLYDPLTDQETPLPPEGGFVTSLSPDGRYAFRVQYPDPPSDLPAPQPPPVDGTAPATVSQLTIALFDRLLGTQQSAALTELDASYWRPGHDELWFAALPPRDDTNGVGPGGYVPTAWRWLPGSDPVVLSNERPFVLFAAQGPSTPFTPDGRFLMTSSPSEDGDKPTATLRDPDAAELPLLTLNPAGTGVQEVRQLPDGRLLVSDWITDMRRCDIYLIDPDAGTKTSLATGGNVVAVGATRILTRLDWVAAGGAGSLTLIDLATGATTLLAENVHAVAVEPPAVAGADPLAPGTRVAYVSRNRVASPYDGVWMVSLP